MGKQIILSDLLHLRYRPHKWPKLKECQPCPAFQLFDWVIWLPHSALSCRFRNFMPRTVLCLAHLSSLQVLLKLKSCLSNSTVIIAGRDTNLSKVLPIVETLLPYCQKIYYEAKDIAHPEIESFSMGFTSFYFYLHRVEFETISQLATLVSNLEWEKQGVLAAWGGIYARLDQILADRRAAVEFVENCPWIQREQLEPADYWQRLAESKFLLAPAGNGIQSPKLAEAWLMRTVPIVTDNPCFRDLQAEGFPLLIIDQWNDLTQKLLENFETERCNIDWERVQSMLTLQHFRSRYLLPSEDMDKWEDE